MDYELAKQLKDAGFPQEITLPDRVEAIIDGENGYATPVADYPTLSELIEACGDDLRWLKHNRHNNSKNNSFKWLAQGRPHWKDEEGKSLKDIKVWGSTPEEAIAKLWLELNKK